MSNRLSVIAVTAVLLFGAAACGSDEPSTSIEPPASPTATATQDATDESVDLVGTWRNDEADWTLHLSEDGTFTEEFEGNVDFRRGSYRVEDDTMYLEADSGETTEGTVVGDTLEFRLATLTRR